MSEISSKKIWVVGDRIITPANQRGLVTSADKKIGITWENGHLGEYTPKQIQAYGYQKFLEEEGAIAPCNNLTSVQELVQDSVMQAYNSDLNLQQSQKLTNTAQASLNCDIQELTTMETCEIYQDLQNAKLDIICTQEESIYLQLPPLAPHSPQKANGLEVQTSVIVSPQSSKPLENYSPNSSPLKTSQDSLPALITQDSPQAHISEAWSEPLTFSGTMRNGLLSEAATLPAPTLESEYCWLRSPGALSLSGKGRPPGQTKQEAELKRLGLINKGEVLNPVILCQWYEIPETWLDPLECRAATELLESNEQQLEIFSILELPALPLTESSTSTPCVENQSASLQQQLKQSDIKLDLYICNSSSNIGKIIEVWETCFTVDWNSEIKCYFWERDEQIIAELALAQPAAGIAPQHLIDKFLEEKSRCQVVPENFLEETERAAASTKKPKSRQRKGCLYRYIENKKLKNGTIASYPRVIGHRHPDNPTHWRWGFNWEEKMDGEWKGRSFGCVPLGAIALIQSMQNEGVSLEEIIGFIKRAKTKK